jgi:hypothetical protein
VMWCGVVWCGVAWCGVVWRGVRMRHIQNSLSVCERFVIFSTSQDLSKRGGAHKVFL